jgi:hypothetical protein
MSYKKQKLLTLREYLDLPVVLLWVPCWSSNKFFVLCFFVLCVVPNGASNKLQNGTKLTLVFVFVLLNVVLVFQPFKYSHYQKHLKTILYVH